VRDARRATKEGLLRSYGSGDGSASTIWTLTPISLNCFPLRSHVLELARKLKVAPLRIITISAYLRENVHYTFSGFNFMAAFLDLLLEVGVERIMFSADYPYASMTEARGFLNQLPVSTADKERIAHRNAERLFGL
jgi:predicted TIM-barrel fold metal-dependent hydrolase